MTNSAATLGERAVKSTTTTSAFWMPRQTVSMTPWVP